MFCSRKILRKFSVNVSDAEIQKICVESVKSALRKEAIHSIESDDFLPTGNLCSMIADKCIKNLVQTQYTPITYKSVGDKLSNLRINTHSRYKSIDLIDIFDAKKSHFPPKWNFSGVEFNNSRLTNAEKVDQICDMHHKNGDIIAFTDGSARIVDKKLVAGAGVCFYNDHAKKYTISEAVPAEMETTSQNAELFAIIRALDVTSEESTKTLVIFTDFSGVHSAFERLVPRRFDFDTEESLINDTVKLELLCKLNRRPVTFYFIKSGVGLNAEADKLASRYAKLYDKEE